MKSVCLIGFGAEIGSNLVGMNRPEIDGFLISDVITRPPNWQDSRPIESIMTRLLFANPNLFDTAKIIDDEMISINGRKVKFHFYDVHDAESFQPAQFSACVVATSKSDISDINFMNKVLTWAPIVFSVAESDLQDSMAFYVNLQGLGEHLENKITIRRPEKGFFHFGSCQSNGWHAILRTLCKTLKNSEVNNSEVLALQSDIVHPDTPTGSLGTRTMNPRDQEARNNLRPGGSQIKKSMDRLFPQSNNLNTISLRTLIDPPGFQINRFFFTYEAAQNKRLTTSNFVETANTVASDHPHILTCSPHPFGSRIFAGRRTAAALLTDEKYLTYYDRFSSTPDGKAMSMLITQSYVDNVKGYCNSVLIGIQKLLDGEEIDVF